MFGFGKEKAKQLVCILAETNSVKDAELDASTLHAEYYDTAEAWGLDGCQQCKDATSGRYIQFISNANCDPIRIYQNHGGEVRNVDGALVSSQTEDQEMTFTSQGKNKNGLVIWVGVCVAMITLGVLITGLIAIRG